MALTSIRILTGTALFLGVSLTTAFSTQNLASSRLASPLKASIQTYLDDGNYNDIIMGDDKVVLVDCKATWCGPCRLIEPFLEQSADKYADDLDIVKMDVEGKDNGSVKVEFLLQGVMPQALPSLIVFKNGKHVATHTGALNQDQLNDFIESSLHTANGGKKEEERELVGAESGSSGKGFVSFGSMRDDYAL